MATIVAGPRYYVWRPTTSGKGGRRIEALVRVYIGVRYGGQAQRVREDTTAEMQR